MPISGKFEADFASFKAAVDQADVKLRGFEQSSAKVESQLSRMTNSLSGTRVIQEAALMAEAVERVGGVSRLTEAELQRVARQTTEAADKFRALGLEVPQNIQRLSDSLKSTNDVTTQVVASFDRVGPSVKDFVAGYLTAEAAIRGFEIAGRAAIEFLQSSVKEYTAAESAQRRLVAALMTQSTAVPSVIAQYDRLASTFEDTTKFGDDLIKEMQGLLVQVGDVMPSQMQNALTAATDLAAGLDIDLKTATLAVGKALSGETGTLSRYGVEINKAAVEAKGAAAVFTAVQDKFGGQAQAQLETYAGKLEQLANRWGNFKEALGGVIVTNPLVEAGMRSAADAATQLQNSAGGANHSFSDLIQSAASFGDVWPAAAIAAGVRYLEEAAEAANTLAKNLDAVERANPFDKLTAGFTLKPVTEGMELFLKELAEFEKFKPVLDEMLGTKAIEKAEQYLAALEHMRARGLAPIKSSWDEIVTAMDSAIKKMQEAGRTGEAMYAQMLAAKNKFAGLTSEGLLPSKPLGSPLNQAPSIEQDLGMLTDLQDAQLRIEQQRAYEKLVSETNALMKDGAVIVGDLSKAHLAAGDAALEGTRRAARGYEEMTASIHRAREAAFQLNVPQGFDYDEAYRRAGFFVQDRIFDQSKKPLPANPSFGAGGSVSIPGVPGWGGGAPIINIDARESMFDTPAGMQQLADRASQAIMSRLQAAGVRL